MGQELLKELQKNQVELEDLESKSAILEDELEDLQSKSARVVFSVASSNHESLSGYLDWPESLIENGYPLSGDTEFVAPYRGNYEFSFQGHISSNCYPQYANIQVLKNGYVIHEFISQDDETESNVYQTISSSWLVTLDVGDSIILYANGMICDGYKFHRIFTGQLIESL